MHEFHVINTWHMYNIVMFSPLVQKKGKGPGDEFMKPG